MFIKIKLFFQAMNRKIDSIDNDLDKIGNLILQTQNLIAQHERLNHDWFTYTQNAQAEMNKKISSIEMEMLLSSGACLYNNFEGKENM
jgi:hypothetical protein